MDPCLPGDTARTTRQTWQRMTDCDVGAQALSKAANQAIEAMTKDYIARVVGSGVI